MQYRPAVDIVRVIAAVCIVCFHSPGTPYKSIFLSGLSYFVLLTFCMQSMQMSSKSVWDHNKRAIRLLVPWMTWSLFYAALMIAMRQPLLQEMRQSPSSFLVGPKFHLWFLPFAFLGGIFGSLLLRLTARLPAANTLALFGIVTVALALAGKLLGENQQSPIREWRYAFPLVPIGLAIGQCPDLSKARLVSHYCAILAVGLFVSWFCTEPSYLIGLVALMASILPRCRDLVWLKWAAGFSMGIYLLHPAVFLIVYKYYPNLPWYAFATASTIGSIVCSAIVMPFPALARLAFGTAHRPNR